MKKYGYVRVSTQEQNEDRQMIEMKDLHMQNQSMLILQKRILHKDNEKDFIDKPV